MQTPVRIAKFQTIKREYQTFAAATAALPDLEEGQLVVVYEDETNSNQVSRYKVELGSFVSIPHVTKLSDGGTGASDAPTARTNLGLGSAATLSQDQVFSQTLFDIRATPFTASPSKKYFCNATFTVTLPDTTTLSGGEEVRFFKSPSATPVIQVFDDLTETISTEGDLGPESVTTITYDIQVEIVFVWTGSTWVV